MLNTNFTELFKLISENPVSYLVFICILVCTYFWIKYIALFLTECLIKIILAMRAPIQMNLPKEVFNEFEKE